MGDFKVNLTEETVRFYQRVADRVGLPIEQVLSDALFKLAGDLAMCAMSEQRGEKGTS